MKVLFLRSCDRVAPTPTSTGTDLDAAVAAGLAAAGELQEVAVTLPASEGWWSHAAGRGLGMAPAADAGLLDEVRAAALACDRLVTSGWVALEACERIGVVADVHVMADFSAPLGGQAPSSSASGPEAADEERRFALTNRARHLLVRRCVDVGRLRSRGRFPSLLFTGRADCDPVAIAVPTVRVTELGALLAECERTGHAELSVGAAIGRVAPRSIPDVGGLLDACLCADGPSRIQTVNLQHIHLAMLSPVFREVIAAAPAITADGWPVVRMLRRNGYQAVERATGADLVARLLDDPRARGLRLALVGGSQRPGAAFAERARAAGAKVVLREHGDKRDWVPAELATRLNVAGASLTLVAVTQPAGDLLAAELVAAGYRGTAIGIGAAVELFVGGERRAPQWVQDLRLEWLYRFVQDPRRLWRRYFVEGLPTYFGVVSPIIRMHSLAQYRRREPLPAH
ncbi:MAG TPA: WecB/TagA/CpsF family glycosyltransferase [Propionicimonas sp.]